GIKAPAAPMRTLGGPHLLERRPVIGRPLACEQPTAVDALEAEIHLQAAVVAVAGVRRPATFEVVDAEPLPLVRGILGAPARLERDAVPHRDLCLDVGRRVLEVAGELPSHRALPMPGLVAVSVDLMLDVALRP